MRTSEMPDARGRGRGPPEGTFTALAPVPPCAPMTMYCVPDVGNEHETVAVTVVNNADRLFEHMPSQFSFGSVESGPGESHSKSTWAKTEWAQRRTARNDRQ